MAKAKEIKVTLLKGKFGLHHEGAVKLPFQLRIMQLFIEVAIRAPVATERIMKI